jgi:hypothetical protein
MDKLTEYRKLIKRILTEYIELCARHPQPDIETFLITDEQNGHYIWMNLGWPNTNFLKSCYRYSCQNKFPSRQRSNDFFSQIF